MKLLHWVAIAKKRPRSELDKFRLAAYVEYYQRQIKILRPTLEDIYSRILALNARELEDRAALLNVNSDTGADSAGERAQLELRLQATSANADAYGHAFVMIINPLLLTLREETRLSVFSAGPELQPGMTLGRLLWLLGDHIRHHHQLSKIGLNHLMISSDITSDHYGEALAGIRINAKLPTAARAAIVRYAMSSYDEFEQGLLRIGDDILASFVSKSTNS